MKFILVIIFYLISFNTLFAEVYLTKYGSYLLISPEESSEKGSDLSRYYINEYSEILVEFRSDLEIYESSYNLDSINLERVLHYQYVFEKSTLNRLKHFSISYGNDNTIGIDELKNIILLDIDNISLYLEKWHKSNDIYSTTNFFDNYDESKKYVLLTNEGIMNSKDCEVIQNKSDRIILEELHLIEYADTGKWLTRPSVYHGKPCDIMIWATVIKKCKIKLYKSIVSLLSYPVNYKYIKEIGLFEREIEIDTYSYKLVNRKSNKEVFIKSWVQLE